MSIAQRVRTIIKMGGEKKDNIIYRQAFATEKDFCQCRPLGGCTRCDQRRPKRTSGIWHLGSQRRLFKKKEKELVKDGRMESGGTATYQPMGYQCWAQCPWRANQVERR